MTTRLGPRKKDPVLVATPDHPDPAAPYEQPPKFEAPRSAPAPRRTRMVWDDQDKGLFHHFGVTGSWRRGKPRRVFEED